MSITTSSLRVDVAAAEANARGDTSHVPADQPEAPFELSDVIVEECVECGADLRRARVVTPFIVQYLQGS